MANGEFCLPVRYIGKYPDQNGKMQDATLDRVECMTMATEENDGGEDQIVFHAQKFQGLVDGICRGNAGDKSFFYMVGLTRFKCESVRLLKFF
ncbi:MAG: hypothetical protein HYY43_06180 [Deltaproteobacteria bacterium]|nr:hypothetical protein [Deltaproteobacteria bacterium]MBI2341219.1 hypothetical protein [Deltaproteobacteria bacterium]MBI2975157.1 hypothetical protein [Deltaproteobacteria bacterium]